MSTYLSHIQFNGPEVFAGRIRYIVDDLPTRRLQLHGGDFALSRSLGEFDLEDDVTPGGGVDREHAGEGLDRRGSEMLLEKLPDTVEQRASESYGFIVCRCRKQWQEVVRGSVSLK